jgi:hypothetical protein
MVWKRIVKLNFGLTCNEEFDNTIFLESYNNSLECENKIEICNEKPCPTTIFEEINECDIIIDNLQYVIEDGGFLIEADNIFNATTPYTINWQFDNLCFTEDYQLGDTIFLLPNSNECNNSQITMVITDVYGCTNNATIQVSYKKGCTNPNSINYDATANIDDGTCYDTPLSYTLGYECQGNNSGIISVQQALGGLPPYTFTGNILGDTLPNLTNYSGQVTDSLGNVASDGGTISCPFDCNSTEIIVTPTITCNNDGTGILNISITGGNAPYTITGATNGQTVNDGDELTINVEDTNGCTSSEVQLTVNCPSAIDCSIISQSYFGELTLIEFTGSAGDIARYRYNFVISGTLPSGYSISNINHQITPTNSFSGTLTGNTNDDTINTSSNLNFEGDYLGDPAFANLYSFNVEVTITFSNGVSTCDITKTFLLQGVNPSFGTTNFILQTINSTIP